MTHLEAVLIYLLKHNGQWCGINQIRYFTKDQCKSECFQINTRVSELRTKFNYDIENDTYYSNGIRCSRYRINLKAPTLVYMRSLYPWKTIPKYNVVRALDAQYTEITTPKTRQLEFL